MGKLIRNIIGDKYLKESPDRVKKLKDEKEIREALADKVIEEAKEVAAEFRKRLNKKALIEELGDLLEVIYTIESHFKIHEQKVIEAADDKYEKKGGYEDYYYKLKK